MAGKAGVARKSDLGAGRQETDGGFVNIASRFDARTFLQIHRYSRKCDKSVSEAIRQLVAKGLTC